MQYSISGKLGRSEARGAKHTVVEYWLEILADFAYLAYYCFD